MGREEIVVVGAGITGLSVAWHLLERGLGDVVVYDREGVGAGASGVQPGGVRQQWGTPVNCVMARDSLRFYLELRERLDARVDPGFRACGYLFLAHSDEALVRLAANVELQRGLAIPSSLLEPAAAAEVAPELDPDAIVGASFCPEDGYFDRPQSVVEAFAAAVTARGGEIRHAGVEAIAGDGGGWVVHLGEGDVRADRVVVAAAADSVGLLAPLGVELPIEPEDRHLFFSDPLAERLLEPLIVSPERRFAAKQLADGRLLASDLSANGDADADRERWRRHVRTNVEEVLPRLVFVPLPQLVTGVYDVTPDHQALLGAIPGHDGLFVAAGFSGHGFMMAPEVGRGLAALVAGEEPGAHFSALAPDRFERGASLPEEQVV